jgi:dolichyl-diphosphooligosaccharide--protein glycosyltransferase
MIGGANSPEAIRSILVFIPAIGGTLLLFPVYLFTKEVFNKRAGVLAAFLVIIMPGQILHRSMLGFNDHHIWEVFWMVSTFALFSYSFNVWKGEEASKNIRNTRKLIAPILTGISLGMYLLAWAPGFILAFMIIFFAFLVFIFKDYYSPETTDNIVYISIITFLVAALVYSPFSNTMPGFVTMHYTVFQLLILIGSAGVIAIFHGIEILQRKGYYTRFGEVERFAFPATIFASTIVVMGLVSTLSPDFFNLLSGIFKVIQPAEGQLTIAEVQPFFSRGGSVDLLPAWINFGMTFFFGMPALIYIIYITLTEKQPLHFLVLIFSISMLVALTGQNRFAYYFGAVSAILGAVFIELLLRIYSNYTVSRKTQRIYLLAGIWLLTLFLVFTGVDKTLPFLVFFMVPVITLEALLFGLRSLKNDDISLDDVINTIDRYKESAVVVAIVLILIAPLVTVAYPTYKNAELQSKAAGSINKQWWDALIWMRENTPEPGLDYYAIYKPGVQGERYPYYPNSTYGVMSWWDYGHWITAVSRRIPNANPFQQGIGMKGGDAGSAPFFTAFEEVEANQIADELGVKYVVTDVEMATGKFYAMATWAENSLNKAGTFYFSGPGYVFASKEGIGITPYRTNIPPDANVLTAINMPNENYFRTMEARFHIFDGNGLEHYRMIYESGYESENFLTMEAIYRLTYNLYYTNLFDFQQPEIMSTGYVKIFEYVKGAKITGTTDADTVELELTLKTNQGRTVLYQQKAEVKDGVYEFTVPYAHDAVSAITLESHYRLKAGNVTQEVIVSEEDVVNGNVLKVNL